MKIADVAATLENIAPLLLQEDYDNAGLLTGDPDWDCTGILTTLDVTPAVVEEAIAKGCNCIVAHHPVIFRGLKKITANTYTGRALIEAIKSDVAIYTAHTNLDNVAAGVNARIADCIGLENRRILAPRRGILKKLYTYVPALYLDELRDALFEAGGGNISNYSECSFTSDGKGTFKAGEGSTPFSGSVGQRQEDEEVKLEMIFPAWLEGTLLDVLSEAHPYEEAAYEVIALENAHQETGSGMVGETRPLSELQFLELLANQFHSPAIRHTAFTGKTIRKVAICGGSGSFLIPNALRAGADAYVTADIKYHEFFDAEGKLLLCDIGHFESEQFTVDLFTDIFLEKFPTFAVLKSEIKTNPVQYFTGK